MQPPIPAGCKEGILPFHQSLFLQAPVLYCADSLNAVLIFQSWVQGIPQAVPHQIQG